ncbi:mucin-17-like [Aphis gossypii]|uniref:mucin-17-like n=1 Tax=Aphis gossypii TaxID=80765 RepID=UPI0021598811|nr:mucin-17-like [Aphis gossypii]
MTDINEIINVEDSHSPFFLPPLKDIPIVTSKGSSMPTSPPASTTENDSTDVEFEHNIKSSTFVSTISSTLSVDNDSNESDAQFSKTKIKEDMKDSILKEIDVKPGFGMKPTSPGSSDDRLSLLEQRNSPTETSTINSMTDINEIINVEEDSHSPFFLPPLKDIPIVTSKGSSMPTSPPASTTENDSTDVEFEHNIKSSTFVSTISSTLSVDNDSNESDAQFSKTKIKEDMKDSILKEIDVKPGFGMKPTSPGSSDDRLSLLEQRNSPTETSTINSMTDINEIINVEDSHSPFFLPPLKDIPIVTSKGSSMPTSPPASTTENDSTDVEFEHNIKSSTFVSTISSTLSVDNDSNESDAQFSKTKIKEDMKDSILKEIDVKPGFGMKPTSPGSSDDRLSLLEQRNSPTETSTINSMTDINEIINVEDSHSPFFLPPLKDIPIVTSKGSSMPTSPPASTTENDSTDVEFEHNIKSSTFVSTISSTLSVDNDSNESDAQFSKTKIKEDMKDSILKEIDVKPGFGMKPTSPGSSDDRLSLLEQRNSPTETSTINSMTDINEIINVEDSHSPFFLPPLKDIPIVTSKGSSMPTSPPASTTENDSTDVEFEHNIKSSTFVSTISSTLSVDNDSNESDAQFSKTKIKEDMKDSILKEIDVKPGFGMKPTSPGSSDDRLSLLEQRNSPTETSTINSMTDINEIINVEDSHSPFFLPPLKDIPIVTSKGSSMPTSPPASTTENDSTDVEFEHNIKSSTFVSTISSTLSVDNDSNESDAQFSKTKIKEDMKDSILKEIDVKPGFGMKPTSPGSSDDRLSLLEQRNSPTETSTINSMTDINEIINVEDSHSPFFLPPLKDIPIVTSKGSSMPTSPPASTTENDSTDVEFEHNIKSSTFVSTISSTLSVDNDSNESDAQFSKTKIKEDMKDSILKEIDVKPGFGMKPTSPGSSDDRLSLLEQRNSPTETSTINSMTDINEIINVEDSHSPFFLPPLKDIPIVTSKGSSMPTSPPASTTENDSTDVEFEHNIKSSTFVSTISSTLSVDNDSNESDAQFSKKKIKEDMKDSILKEIDVKPGFGMKPTSPGSSDDRLSLLEQRNSPTETSTINSMTDINEIINVEDSHSPFFLPPLKDIPIVTSKGSSMPTSPPASTTENDSTDVEFEHNIKSSTFVSTISSTLSVDNDSNESDAQFSKTKIKEDMKDSI